MAQASGSKARIVYQQETTFKQDPTTPNVTILPFKSESLRSSRNLISSATIRSSRDSAKPVLGNVEASGSIVVELQANIGTWFKAALGSVNTTGTGPYTHTFKIGDLPSLLIEKGFTDIGQYFKYNGCKINRMSLSVTPEGFQELTFDILGAKETVSTSPFDSTPTAVTFAPFTGFEASIEEGGSTLGIVTGCDITLENNLDGSVYVIGGAGERYSLPEGKVKVSGTLKALFESITLYNKAKNSTESTLKITFTKGNGGGSAGNESLEIFLPELIYSPNAPVVEGDKGVLIELPFEAYYDNSSEASSIVITLKNMQETV